jgi:hypothetical protein
VPDRQLGGQRAGRLGDVVASPTVNYFVDTYAGVPAFAWDTALIVVVSTVVSAVLGAAGWLKSRPHGSERNGI